MSFPVVTAAEVRAWLTANRGAHRALCHCAGVSEYKLSRWLNTGAQLSEAELSRLAGAVGVLERGAGFITVRVPSRRTTTRIVTG